MRSLLYVEGLVIRRNVNGIVECGPLCYRYENHNVQYHLLAEVNKVNKIIASTEWEMVNISEDIAQLKLSSE